MKAWIDRFFKLNRQAEVELEGFSIDRLRGVLRDLKWDHSDEFWSPDLQVDLFERNDSELFVIQETYFDPKLTGVAAHLDEILATRNTV